MDASLRWHDGGCFIVKIAGFGLCEQYEPLGGERCKAHSEGEAGTMGKKYADMIVSPFRGRHHLYNNPTNMTKLQ